MKLIIMALIISLSTGSSQLLAAVGCSLNDPDRDVKRLFPASTGYLTEFISIEERGGKELVEEIENKLGSKLDPIYETADVPYAYYTVLRGKEPIGRIHGVNQKGMYGGMQLILATDLEGKIIAFYYQKISSPEAKKFREAANTEQFIGITLADFYRYDRNNAIAGNKIAQLKSPSAQNNDDFINTVRGIRKNLILLDIFKLNRTYDQFYSNSKGDADER